MDKSLLISRSFWTLFTLETLASVVYIIWATRDTRHSGPEGPVGLWLVYVVPPILLAIPLAVVLIGRSQTAMVMGLCCLGSPLVPVVVGPIYSAAENFRTERSIAGDLNFFWPSQRKLAHAVQAHDVELVKALIPRAGDLNAEHRGESLFSFALTNSDKSNASVEIVKAMLEHGANPNLRASNRSPVLLFAMSSGPAMIELLLKAGADPNVLDGGKPVWWDVFYQDSSEGAESLKLLLDQGADVTRCDSEGGPVGRAAYFKNWRAVWMLMEHGASWKNEPALGQPIAEVFEQDLAYRRYNQLEIPPEMEKIRAVFHAERSHQ